MADSLRVIFENFAHFYPRYIIFIRSDKITIRHQEKDGNKVYVYPYNFLDFLFQKNLIVVHESKDRIHPMNDVILIV